MKYLDAKQKDTIRDSSDDSNTTSAGRVFYENTCMKAVNQSIGRAIRHRGDYAAILLGTSYVRCIDVVLVIKMIVLVYVLRLYSRLSL